MAPPLLFTPEAEVIMARQWERPAPGDDWKKGERAQKRRSGIPHVRRENFSASSPVHVTVRVCKGVPRLQSRVGMRVIRAAFSVARERLGMRITQYSIQANHIHLIVEATDRHALSRAMKGLCVRIARRLNRATGRKGQVFADRYHAHILRTPNEVRNAVRYVINNSRTHAKRAGRRWRWVIDPYAGGPCPKTFFESCQRLISEPRSYLLRVAWNLPWVRRQAPFSRAPSVRVA